MRTWIPLVILVVVIVGGFTVHRIRGFFGSKTARRTPTPTWKTANHSTLNT